MRLKNRVGASPGARQFTGPYHDRPEVAAFVAACLAHYGYRVTTYTDSESALAAVREGAAAPQLVIRDVMMPGVPLREFVARMRALRPGRPRPRPPSREHRSVEAGQPRRAAAEPGRPTPDR